MGCHPEGLGQAGEVGSDELHEVQQDQEQGPAAGLEPSLLTARRMGLVAFGGLLQSKSFGFHESIAAAAGSPLV